MEDIYKDILEDVETIFHTSNYNVNRLLSMGKKQKGCLVWMMKNELRGQIMKKFVG